MTGLIPFPNPIVKPGSLGVAELASLVDFVPAKAEVGGSHHVFACNMSALLGDLPPLLRVVAFLGEAHFGTGADDDGTSARF